MHLRSMMFRGAFVCGLVSAYAFMPAPHYTFSQVEGSGVHYFTSAVVHAEELTQNRRRCHRGGKRDVQLHGHLHHQGQIAFMAGCLRPLSNGTGNRPSFEDNSGRA